MATEEARSLLNSLMGTHRNDPLPKGAAIPGRQVLSSNHNLIKTTKSCFDKDIDPLYTAWGVDVYELFVNTKSDLGANPNVVDAAAHAEYLRLNPADRDRLGYDYFLFQKLQELTRQCDRTVTRNNLKLKNELQRKQSDRGGQDFVQTVDPAAVEQLVRIMIAEEDMEQELTVQLEKLEECVATENDRKAKLEPILKAKAKAATAAAAAEAEETAATAVKEEEKDDPKDRSDGNDVAMKTEPQPVKSEPEDRTELDALQTELGQLTLQKQRLLFDISHIVANLSPLRDQVASQRRHLDYIKSDISTDKTVCTVSGNFMSSRDADERIAAHYAGKQYVGWKLVRDKLASLIQKYGNYGPPPPARRDPHPNTMMTMGGGGGGRNGPPPMQHRGGGGGGYGRGPPDRGGSGRWERGGGGGYGPPQDRGRGPPPRGNYRR